jgi:hypothetical protein
MSIRQEESAMGQCTLHFRNLLLAGFVLQIAAVGVSGQNPATSVNVDANANQRAINANIYGVSVAAGADVATLNAPLNRLGGETLASTYNWQIDALNLSHDWYWESFLQDSPQTPGAAVDNSIQATYGANVGSQPMVSIPMLPYIANLGPNATSSAASLWSYSVKKYGAQEYDSSDGLSAADPYQTDAGSGLSAATGKFIVNDPLDAYVPNTVAIQQAWLQHLIGKWGLSTSATGVKYYILDNEPSLWSSTHRDVHPAAETYEEEFNNIVTYATAIRAADPNAKIVAPEEWIWWAMYVSGLDQANGTGAGSDYATHNNTYYYPWLLQQIYAYQQRTGTKLIDMLSVHCYNPAPGGSDDSASGQAARNRETRILWDPTFVDPSWEGTLGINGGSEDWIPLMRNWVNSYDPGLEIGCTEYNWGDETALNGATTQADVEGIYGAYGFDFATRWTVPANPGPTYLAMQMYRNYDGKLSAFGDTSVAAAVANPDSLSAYAALRSSDGAMTVMVINKQQGSTPVTVSLANFSTSGTAQAYQISSASQTAITSLGSVTVANNAIVASVPSQSITLYVIPAGSVTSKPSAPTGLAATVGNGTVTLIWNASGGATSYTVQRSLSSAGAYSPIGTVTSPAPTTFTDTGLNNGTAYYYEVSGTNSAGTGPNSAPVAATPLVPPTFAASATASPNPVAQNAATTITAIVKCTANTLANGTVQLVVLDPNGAVALSKNFTAQNFATSQTQSYTASLTPLLAGTYTVEVGVLSTTGQEWSLNTAAGTITVNSALAFTSSATANPVSIATAGSSTISFNVKDTGTAGLTNGIVQLLVIDPDGNQIVQQNWTGENFTAGGTLALTYTFTPSSLTPPATATGAYAVDIGVFNSTWSTDYYWSSNATAVTLTAATAPAALISPKPGSTLAGPGAIFTWSAGSGATGYSLWLGTTGAGSHNLYDSGATTATSVAVAGLPTNGETIYAQLNTITGKTSVHSSYTFKAVNEATLTAPVAGSVLAGASVTFTWSAAPGASGYSLWLGSTGAGSNNLYNSHETTATTVTAAGLPTNGETIYAQINTIFNGASTHNDATYKAATLAQSEITSPAPGSTLTGATVTFTWTPSSGASGYSLWLGTTGPGSNNLYNSHETTATSATAKGLPTTGATIYARLNINFNGVAKYVDYTYTAP